MKPAWLRRSKGMTFLYRIVLFFAWMWLRIFYRTKIYGLENFIEGGAILAPNHVSFLDPPIVSTSWPEEVHFLARETLFTNPLFGHFIRALNAHPVSGDSSDTKVFKTICSLLAEGKKVLLFPEGSRSPDNKLLPIKPGISLFISRMNTAIIPVYIHGAFNVWPRSRKFPKLFGKIACVFGPPIRWSSFSHLDKKEAQLAVAAELTQSLERLRSWYESKFPSQR